MNIAYDRCGKEAEEGGIGLKEKIELRNGCSSPRQRCKKGEKWRSPLLCRKQSPHATI